MKFKHLLITITLILLSSNTQASSIHKWVDAQGNIHYGDKPPDNTLAKEVKIRHTEKDIQTSNKKLTDKIRNNISDNDPRLLLLAVRNNDLQTVVKLIRKKTYYNDEALSIAIYRGYLSIFEALLEGPGQFKHDYLNHLQRYAIRNLRPNMLKLIIEKGSNPNIQSRFDSPLIIAINANALECAKLLIAHGADVNQNYSEALHKAVQKHDMKLLTLLIDNGVNVNPGSIRGQRSTPLMTAAYHGYTDTLKKLIDNGADVNARIYNGSTPLKSARSGRKKKAEQILIAAGAK